MLQHPTFKPRFRVEVVKENGLFLLSESQQTVLQGRLYELVAPRLDGRSAEEICRELADEASPAQVFYTIKKLDQQGFLAEHDQSLPAEEAAYWSLQDVDSQTVASRLNSATVAVEAFGVDATPFLSLLESLNVRVSGSSESSDDRQLGVVLTDNCLCQELEEYNRESLRIGREWMLVKPTGNQIWIGPLFRPGQSACWNCLAERFRSNLPVMGLLDSLNEQTGLPSTDHSHTAASLSVAWGLAANTVAEWIVHEGDLPQLDGKIQTVDLVSWKTESHTLLKQPFCAECGEPIDSFEPVAQPLSLESSRKTYTEDGGHRAHSPQETLDKYSYHVSPICGAVTMLERSAPSDDGVMHVYVSGNNIARGPQNLANLKVDLRNSSCGKGINDLQAKASALCEGLERYSGMFRGDEPWRRARFVDLGSEAIAPNECMLYSEEQYAAADELESDCPIYSFVPNRFDPEREIDWTPVWSLTHETHRFLPTAFCYFDYPNQCESDFCAADSNGNAAGNTIEEAILQGFLEVVERDSVALWWYNRARVPAIDLDSVDEPYIQQLRDFLKQHHRELWVLDLTSDLQIPSFAALSRRTDGSREQIMFGFGAHFDARIGLLRSITELNQMLVHIIDSPPDGPPAHLSDDDTLEWLQTATLANDSYLAPAEEPLRPLSFYDYSWTDDLKEDVLLCKERVENLGHEMLVLDQTRSEIGLPVVKVIVPGLRHFWRRYAAGRLYDIPVKLGWLDKPLREEQLNTSPMFL
jgi:ribosomal protein S12 methylthiotransferase accessory factor